MATVITSECINCGACESECPNNAIFQGGVEWEWNGTKHPPLSMDTFYIVPEKCTECVGFHGREACAVVCPVDCCIPDPERPETEDVLLQRARELHPDKSFGPDFPSRFKGSGARGMGAAPSVSAAPLSHPSSKAVSTPPAVAASKPPEAPSPVAEAAIMAPPSPPASEPTSGPRSVPAPVLVPAAEEPSTPAPSGLSDLPEMGDWDVPIDCRHCKGSFAVEFRYFRSGMVLRCPYCEGATVVNGSMYKRVATLLRDFYDKWKREYEEFQEKRHRQLSSFTEQFRSLRSEFHPAGAPRKRAGIFG